jgi:hypothetical protein
MQNQPFIKYVFAANLTMFAVLVTLFFASFTNQSPVLSVERLNIVDSLGNPVLVLSNGARLPGAVFGRREYPQSFVGRGRSAGMIFYNESGDEVGGLIYEGASRDSSYRAFGHFSFDQWKQNQVVAVQYQDNGATRSAGLRVWDRPINAPVESQFALAQKLLSLPPGALRDSINQERLRVRAQVEGKQRLFIGSQDKVAKLELCDTNGRLRVRLFVDSAGVARLEFLDASGRVTTAFP